MDAAEVNLQRDCSDLDSAQVASLDELYEPDLVGDVLEVTSRAPACRPGQVWL